MSDKMIYGVTTSVLFDMSGPNAIFNAYGPEAYRQYMTEHMDEPLKLGKGFDFFSKIHNDMNSDIFICSKNSALTGLRAMRTLQKYNLLPNSSCFTNGESLIPYLKAYGVDTFFTSDEQMAQQAQQEGIPSAIHSLPQAPSDIDELKKKYSKKPVLKLITDEKVKFLQSDFSRQTQTHYIFDLDFILFAGESDLFYQKHGLQAYRNYELSMRDQPLAKGTFYPVFKKLDTINDTARGEIKPFKISVVTARGAEATLRALNTLHSWGIDLTGEIHFMDGKSKGPILKILNEKYNMPTIFLDDQPKNIEAASSAGVFAGRAPIRDETPSPSAA